MKVKLENVRLRWCDLFEATQINGKGDYKFRATFLVDPKSDTHKRIEAAFAEVAKENWKDKADIQLKAIRGNNQKCSYTDGNLQAHKGGYEGMMVLSCSNKVRQNIIDANKAPLVESDGKIYPGCYVNAFVDIYFGKEYGGIYASLGPVQFLRSGDAFAGGPVASIDDFDDVSEGAGAEEFS